MPKAAPNPNLLRQLDREQRLLIDRLSQRAAVAPLRKLYTDAILELQHKLEKDLKLGRGDTYTAHTHRLLLGQLRIGVSQLTTRMGSSLRLTSKEAQVESLRDLIKNVGRLQHTFEGQAQPLAIEEAARFYGVIDKTQTSLLAMNQSSVNAYGNLLVSEAEKQLALSLATGETHYDMLKRLENTMQVNWWRAERIARTETSWAFNETRRLGLIEMAKQLPDLGQRWCEHIDDFTGLPLDNRVAFDSVALHGQVALAGKLFTMPPSPNVSAKLWGKQFTAPPNRPNDRAALQPWRTAWGIPGWIWDGGQRHDAEQWFVQKLGSATNISSASLGTLGKEAAAMVAAPST